MARRQHTAEYKTEDGTVEITVQALGGVEGGLLGLKLGAILGPALATAAVAMDNKDSLAMGSAVQAVFSKMPPAEFKALLKEVTQGAQAKAADEFVDVNLAWLDEAFAGEPGSLYRLLVDAIKVNFTNFSRGLGLSDALLSKLKTALLKGMAKAQTTQAAPEEPKA